MYFINGVFHVLHIVIILSSLFLYLIDDLIAVHLMLQATILTSWLIIGPMIKKPGVCLLTELQKKLGLGGSSGFTDSYMVFLSKKLGYKGNDAKKIELITFSVFSVCTALSLFRYLY
ncbi:MAG: hypothetical protein OEY11_10460 [Gammaproteobacteria bacterium]|nr:hypothetical protein [Gammaproteobacteria bacterium]